MFAENDAKQLFELLCSGMPNWELLEELKENFLEIENESNDSEGFYKPDPRNVMMLITIYIIIGNRVLTREFIKLIQILPESDMIICDGKLNLQEATKPLLIHLENHDLGKLYKADIKIIRKIFEDLNWW